MTTGAPNTTRDAERGLTQPKPGRLPADPDYCTEILACHERALDRGDGGYRDPRSGLFVMTAQYLLDRGYCCGNGCRHCPYL